MLLSPTGHISPVFERKAKGSEMPFREDSMDCIDGVEDLVQERMQIGQRGRPRPRIVTTESEHGPSADAGADESDATGGRCPRW